MAERIDLDAATRDEQERRLERERIIAELRVWLAQEIPLDMPLGPYGDGAIAENGRLCFALAAKLNELEREP